MADVRRGDHGFVTGASESPGLRCENHVGVQRSIAGRLPPHLPGSCPELGGLEPNEPVRITWDALPNRVWDGKTEIIPKQVVPRGSRSVGELLCSVNNEKLELLPNINVDVRISARERNNVLTVPRSAVESDGGKRFVFIVKGAGLNVGKNSLEKRIIAVGIADAANYEVLSGLNEGEMVALPGDFDLHDGMLVKVVNSDASQFWGRPSAN